jgi:sugar phosphate isomerase/epimerase
MSATAWRYGFSVYPNLPPAALRERCLRILDAGFEWMEAMAAGDLLAEADFLAYGETLRAVAAETGAGLSVHLPTTDVNPLARNRRIRQASIEAQRAGLAWAAELGASLAVLHPGQVGGAADQAAIRSGPAWAQASGLLRELAACGRDLGVELTIENLIGPREVVSDPGLLVELCREVGLRATIDFSHALLAGHPPDAFTRQLAGLLRHVHLNDTDGASDRHWPLGRGVVPAAACAQALAEIGFDGVVVLEMDGPPEVVADSRATFAPPGA